MVEKKTQKDTGDQTPSKATVETTVVGATETSDTTWKLATEAQAKAYFAGKPESGRRYKVVQQGRRSVLMITTKR